MIGILVLVSIGLLFWGFYFEGFFKLVNVLDRKAQRGRQAEARAMIRSAHVYATDVPGERIIDALAAGVQAASQVRFLTHQLVLAERTDDNLEWRFANKNVVLFSARAVLLEAEGSSTGVRLTFPKVWEENGMISNVNAMTKLKSEVGQAMRRLDPLVEEFSIDPSRTDER